MKVVILAGGLGSRLSEHTDMRPKPMVEIGGKPILWHIMKHYAHYGFDEFYIAAGYKSEVIKRYFTEYAALQSDVTLDTRTGAAKLSYSGGTAEKWCVHVVDTGATTMTGGRIKRLEPFLKDAPFLLTYGDGLSSVALDRLLGFHRAHGKIATVTAVRPPARFGGLVFEGERVKEFQEKPQIGEGWINGGFMVFEPGVFKYLPGDEASLEATTLTRLAAEGQLMAWKHESFWQCMDTQRELKILEGLWDSGDAPWRVWS